MAVPKTRKSKSRKRMRQTSKKVSAVQTVKCKKCGKQKLPHRLCKSCGS